MVSTTRLLCLEDSYLKECDANVIEVSGANGNEIVLDQTVFYPRGGGQPSDTGKLVLSDGLGDSGSVFRVLEVMKKDGKVVHVIRLETGNTKLETNQKVRCILDWERRYKLMRMHTAAHVLGATMYNVLGVLISGNQLEEDKSRFDFSLESFDRTKFEEIVKKANEFLVQNQDAELKTYSLPREEAMKIPGVVKLAAALPPSIHILRIVEIPGIDIQADGGTHVRNLKEVGKIEMQKLENKGKENRRIYFTLSS